jgi:hypothetical protein
MIGGRDAAWAPAVAAHVHEARIAATVFMAVMIVLVGISHSPCRKVAWRHDD